MKSEVDPVKFHMRLEHKYTQHVINLNFVMNAEEIEYSPIYIIIRYTFKLGFHTLSLIVNHMNNKTGKSSITFDSSMAIVVFNHAYYVVRPVGSEKLLLRGPLNDLFFNKEKIPNIMSNHSAININLDQIDPESSMFIANDDTEDAYKRKIIESNHRRVEDYLEQLLI